MIDGLDPGAEEPVEFGDVGGQAGLDLDEELEADRLEDPFDLPAALWPPRSRMHQAHPEAGTRPQQLS